MLSPRGFPCAFYHAPVHCLRRAKSYFLLIFMKAIKAKREIKRKRGASAILTSRDIPRVLPCTFFYSICAVAMISFLYASPSESLPCFANTRSSMLCHRFHALPHQINGLPCSAPQDKGFPCSALRGLLCQVPTRGLSCTVLPIRGLLCSAATRSSMLCHQINGLSCSALRGLQ